MKDKADWQDNMVEEYKDLSQKDGDDCCGLGRIEVRLAHPTKFGRKHDRVFKIIGEPDHDTQEFLILGFKERGFRGGGAKADRSFYSEFCDEAKARLQEVRVEVMDYAKVF